MINPEMGREIASKVYLLYANSQSALEQQLAKRVEEGLEDIPSWLSSKQRDLSSIKRSTRALVTKLNKETDPEAVMKMITEAYNQGILSADKDANVKLGARLTSRATVRIAEELSDSLLKCNINILKSVDKAYKESLGIAAANVTNGVETVKQAQQRFLNTLADRGMTQFKDKSGRNWNVASYAEMATRTASGNAMLQGHIDRQISMGRDLILISAHAGACPICAEFQGQVVSISGNDPNYPSLAEAQSAGLFHPNCEHSLTGYIEGVSHTISPEEAKYDPEQYKYIQEQRYNERQLRRWKDRLGVAITPQEQAKAKAKIGNYQLRQRDLLKEYSSKYGQTLKRHYNREGKLPKGAKGVTSLANVRIPSKNPLVAKNTVVPKTTPKVREAKLPPQIVEERRYDYFSRYKDSFKGENTKFLSGIEKAYEKAPEWYKSTFEKMDKLKLIKDGDKAYYMHSKKVIAIDLEKQSKDPRGEFTTLFHELGHKMDASFKRLSRKKEYVNAMKSDVLAFQNKVAKELYDSGALGNSTMDKLTERGRKYVNSRIGKNLFSPDANGISDVFGGMTDNEAMGGYGHSKLYWKRNDVYKECASELFAHMSAATVVQGKRLELIKEYFPETYKEFIKLVTKAGV